MKLFSALTPTVVLLSLSHSVIFAQEEVGRVEAIDLKTEKKNQARVGKPEKGGRGMHRSFSRLDEDENGFLSFTEFSGSARLARLDVEKRRTLFDFLDRNNDQRLERSELGPRHSERLAAIRVNFQSLDVDQNNKLSFEEFSADSAISGKEERERKMIFKHLDSNQDGFIILEELKKAPKSKDRMNLDFKKHDEDQSGSLNYLEYSNLPFVSRFSDMRRRKHFEHMDVNGDGEISLKEIHAAHKRPPHPRHGGAGRGRSRGAEGRGGLPRDRHKGRSRDQASD